MTSSVVMMVRVEIPQGQHSCHNAWRLTHDKNITMRAITMRAITMGHHHAEEQQEEGLGGPLQAVGVGKGQS